LTVEKLGLFPNSERQYTVLALGSHPDDIELGCGGTLMRMRAELGDRLSLWYVVFSCGSRDGRFPCQNERGAEARDAARTLGVREEQCRVFTWPVTFFPDFCGEIKKEMVKLRDEIGDATITHIFTHHRHDQHQDHRVIAENTWRTFRNHLILEYEVSKYEGDLESPNLYVDLGGATEDGTPEHERYALQKVELLQKCFPSRDRVRADGLASGTRSHLWWDERLFLGHMRLRGVESNNIYAEAFHARKMVW
jgi:LmbE family N-acetylglucosaminyl deacetylase